MVLQTVITVSELQTLPLAGVPKSPNRERRAVETQAKSPLAREHLGEAGEEDLRHQRPDQRGEEPAGSHWSVIGSRSSPVSCGEAKRARTTYAPGPRPAVRRSAW